MDFGALIDVVNNKYFARWWCKLACWSSQAGIFYCVSEKPANKLPESLW